MYTMVCTRPNLAQVISVVLTYMENLGKQHLNAVKWIFHMALTEASNEALWLTRLAKEFGIAQDLVVIQNEDIAIEKVHTDENASNCLTKPVTAEKFRHCLSLLNLVTC
ncbi:hypothetical protein ACE6H2_026292 [Prunus campanulata]